MMTRAVFSVAPTSSTARNTNDISLSTSICLGSSMVANSTSSVGVAGDGRPAEVELASGGPPGPAAPGFLRSQGMLLGRQRELAEIRRVIEEARAGRSGVLALVGEAGIGKSSLLEEAGSLCEGMLVLRARGVPSEAQIPFAGLFELLRPALGCLDRIPEPQAEALEGALALRPARSADRFAVGAATLSLLAAYAETQPLVLLVDDAHWLDGSSADALLFASRRLVADPIAILLTARLGLPSLLDGADLPVLAVEGLDLGASAQLLSDAAPELVERLHTETGGNPLALLELADEPLDTTPLDAPVPVLTSVSKAYLQRAEALPETTQEALVLAAATDRADLSLFARAGEQLGVGVSELEPAEARGLLDVRGGRLEFRHPLARTALYAGAPPDTRRRVHLALASALPDADVDRRAWHLAVASPGPDDVASSALEQAGMRARERSAYDPASRAFERAAQLATGDGRRGRLLAAAADAAWFGGDADRSLELLGEADRLSSDVELAHLRGHILLRRGPIGDARELLLDAVDRADPPLAAEILADAVYGGFWAADADWMRACVERAHALAPRADDPRTAFFIAIVHGIAGVFSGDPAAGDALRAAAAIHGRTPELRDDPRLLAFALVGPLWLRESAFGHEIVDRSLAIARSLSAVGVLPQLLVHVGIEQAGTDRSVEAEAAFDEAIALAQETGQRRVLADALSRLALLDARLGRETACRERVATVLPLA